MEKLKMEQLLKIQDDLRKPCCECTEVCIGCKRKIERDKIDSLIYNFDDNQ